MIGGGDLNLAPGQVERLSDIFAVGLAPAGDWDDAQIKFEALGPDEPGSMACCTVQENTTFGADFRVAKQELGAGGQANPLSDVVGSQDNHVTRNTLTSVDSIGRNFTIAAGANVNTHIFYFRHPDYGQCEIVDPNTNVRALPGYGLEIRMIGPDGLIVAGGTDVASFSPTYLGDKTDRNGGSNTRYRVQLEDSGQNSASNRPYKLHCQSGSGHTMGDLILYQVPGDLFRRAACRTTHAAETIRPQGRIFWASAQRVEAVARDARLHACVHPEPDLEVASAALRHVEVEGRVERRCVGRRLQGAAGQHARAA